MSRTLQTKPVVLLISANAFSGSTLFGCCLGCHPEVVNLGEVINLENDYHENIKCTCGSRLGECSFWQDIKGDLDRNLAVGRLTFNLNKASTRMLIDKKGVSLKKLLSILGFGTSWIYGNDMVQNYIQKNVNFYKDLHNHFDGSKIFIDCSKVPERLEILSNNDELDVYAVHLRRDLVSVFDSNYKRKKITRSNYGMKFIREFVLLFLREKHRARIFNKIPNSKKITVDYDEFIETPEEVIMTVLNLILDKVSPLRMTDNTLTISEQHLYVGNRWIFNQMSKEIKLKKPTRTVIKSGTREMLLKFLFKL